MSFCLPAYLLLSRHHIFYFRVAVPVPLRAVLSRSEIRISLRTSDRRVAVSEARKWKVLYCEWFETIACMKIPAPKLINTYSDHALWGVWFETPTPSGRAQMQKYIKLPLGRNISAFDLKLNDDGSVMIQEIFSEARDVSEFGVKLHADGSVTVDDIPNDATDEQAKRIGTAASALVEQIRNLSPTRPTFTDEPLPLRSQSVKPPSEINENKSDLRMSTVLDIYQKEKLVGKRWNGKTDQQNMSRLLLVCVYLDDPDISTVRPLQITNMKQDLHYLPTNLPIDGLSHRRLHAVIKLQRRRERTNRDMEKTISITTLNAYLSRLSGFMDWCVDQGYTNVNSAHKKTIRRNKNRDDDGDESRVAWANEELKTIFESRFYSGHMYIHAYQYWLPLLAVFTGARINELSQLHTSDIQFDEECKTWCIKIFPDRKLGQRIKNEKGKRLIPIHPKLVDLGFIKFHEERVKLAKSQPIQLFTGLSLQRDGYGKNASRWFNDTFKGYLGYKTNDGKVFHSFRRNVITQLKQFLLSPTFGKQIDKKDIITKAIVGHKGDVDITWDYYAGDFRPSVLKPVVDHLSWPVVFAPYKHPDDKSGQRLKDWLREKGK